MRLQVSALRETLEVLEPVVPKQPRVNALKGALIDDGKACATDMDATVVTELAEADGRCLIPVREAIHLLKGIPGYLSVNVEQQKDTLSLSWEGGSAELSTDYPEDYPPMPEVDGVTLDLDERLVHALKESVIYCAKEESRPVLNGVTLSFGDELEVDAADGFRMAHAVVPISVASEAHRQVIVPAQTATLLGKLWKKSPSNPETVTTTIADLVSSRKLSLTLDKNKACFRFGRISLFTRLIEGTPPDFKRLIPRETPKAVQFFAPELLRVVKQMEQIADKVRLVWEDGTLTVSAKNDERESEVTLPATTIGEPGRVALSSQYLREYLKDKQGMVTMGAISDKEPVTFRSSSPVLAVIMPMMVDW